MAGSYRHVVNEDYSLISNEDFPYMIADLEDAYEAIEEMWHMIDILSGGDKSKIEEASFESRKRILNGNTRLIWGV